MKNIIFSHDAPKNTCADVESKINNIHCGSPDIRSFLENYEVMSIFSGHIHQTVFLSGQFEDNVNNCKVFATGNTGIDGPIHYL